MQSGRAKKILQLAMKRPKVRSVSKQPVLEIHDLIKLSLDCHVHEGTRNEGKKFNNHSGRSNKRVNAWVRQLRDKYIKVEDENGKYRPQIIEMKEWPELKFDFDQTPFTRPKIVESLPTNSGVKRQLCELCNSYIYDIQHHLNGFEHKRNAQDDKLFESLDALIGKVPTIMDLIKKF